MSALNPRQLKFVENYLATGNATQSYIDAGYKAEGDSAGAAAARLLGDVRVCRAIEDARARSNEKQGITAEWFAERVKLESTREGAGSSHAARVSALKLAGDLLGVGETHKHQHSGPGGGPLVLTGLSDAELDQRIAALEARTPAPPGDAGLPDVPAPLPAPAELGLATPLIVPGSATASDEPGD